MKLKSFMLGIILYISVFCFSSQLYLKETPFKIASSGINAPLNSHRTATTGIIYYFEESDLISQQLSYQDHTSLFYYKVNAANLSNSMISELLLTGSLGYTIKDYVGGISLSCSYSKAKGYDDVTSFSGDLWSNWRIAMLTALFKTHNLLTLAKSDLDFQKGITLDFWWKEMEYLELGTTIELEEEHPTSFSLCSVINTNDILSLIASYKTATNSLSYGVRINFNSFELVYGLRTHTELQATHALSIAYSW